QSFGADKPLGAKLDFRLIEQINPAMFEHLRDGKLTVGRRQFRLRAAKQSAQPLPHRTRVGSHGRPHRLLTVMLLSIIYAGKGSPAVNSGARNARMLCKE